MEKNTDNTGGIKRWQVDTMLILLLLLLITLGLIFYIIAFKKSSTSTVTLKNTTPKTNAVVNPYKGWLTYTNPTYGYSFKYPSSWVISSNTQNNTDVITATSPNGYKFQYSEISTLTFASGGEQIIAKNSIININSTSYYKYYINSKTLGCETQMGFQYEVVNNTCITSFSNIEIGGALPSSIKDQSGTTFKSIVSPATINIGNHTIFISFILPNISLVSNFPSSTINQTLNLILKSIIF
jgi:hypothetical protein